MKNIFILSLLLAFFFLTGCQSINETENQNAAKALISSMESLKQQADKLSVDAGEKYITLTKEIYEYVSNINNNPNEFNSQEKIDEVTEKYKSYLSQIESIASENNITLASEVSP